MALLGGCACGAAPRSLRTQDSRSHRRISSVGALCALLVAGAGALAPVEHAAATSRPRPDLALVEGRLTSTDYAFKGETRTFTFEARTKHVGRGWAPVSLSRLWLVDPHGNTINMFSLRVPRLTPGHSWKHSASDTWLFASE